MSPFSELSVRGSHDATRSSRKTSPASSDDMLVADDGNNGRLWCRSGAGDKIRPEIDCELDLERSRWRWVGVPFFVDSPKTYVSLS